MTEHKKRLDTLINTLTIEHVDGLDSTFRQLVDLGTSYVSWQLKQNVSVLGKQIKFYKLISSVFENLMRFSVNLPNGEACRRVFSKLLSIFREHTHLPLQVCQCPGTPNLKCSNQCWLSRLFKKRRRTTENSSATCQVLHIESTARPNICQVGIRKGEVGTARPAGNSFGWDNV